MAELSPMMKQYLSIKEKNKDSILFFRLGDFYEMFFDDALTVSKELELTLTGRDCGQEERAPMCGVPYHSCETYIAKLVANGHKVAICEQTEDPATAKGLVKRDIIRVITPGTVMEDSMLDESKNNFICAVLTLNGKHSAVFCDISTGELYGCEIDQSDDCSQLKSELSRYNPSEMLLGGEVGKLQPIASFISEKLKVSVEMVGDEYFDYESAKNTVLTHFKKETLEELGLENYDGVVKTVGGLLRYLSQTQITGLERINHIELYGENRFMHLDYNTKRNLELTETMRSKEKKGSLLWVLDCTKTAMGKRLIRRWIEQPLLSCAAIIRRQNAVEELCSDAILRGETVSSLTGFFDMERLMTKIVYGSANARDLRALGSALKKLPEIKSNLGAVRSTELKEIYSQIDTLDDMFDLIDRAIVDDPPFSVREGGLIKEGFSGEIDTLKNDMSDSTGILARLEAEQREKTGIPKLKVGYNRVFGYYLEVSNSYKKLVPENYVRKQTLANCERYITPELKEIEGRILGAKDRSTALEYQLFVEVRNAVAQNLERIENTAKAVAKLDVLTSFAVTAVDMRYCRPDVNANGDIIIKDGRHPVVEKLLNDAPFVPNDVKLDGKDNRVAIITGPNMAGKSTYMRQTALIVLMAQIGSFVPASSAEISITDAIYTRVGASDDLASGQSTFMVEMNEVAEILKNATSQSLLILDEIGRGTSTFDGMSIARAVLEHVADKKKLGARTLFATHYHELSVMEELLDGVKNYNIAVKKRGDDITFLRRIVPGGADDSYGIEVAKLAGLPESVIVRAKAVLKELESGKKNERPKKRKKEVIEDVQPQLTLLGSSSSKVEEFVKELDVNTLTPIEALNKLYEIKRMCE
ncbi:MAG: DNA mismatch repair protein MutS [Clostridia bacterium]|nr:DNA mismatch repair protein MutS [Clostridia bacterium]